MFKYLALTLSVLFVGMFTLPAHAARVETCTLDANETGCQQTLRTGKGHFSCIEDTNWATADINIQVRTKNVDGTFSWKTDTSTTWDAAFGDVVAQPIDYKVTTVVRLVMSSFVADDVDCSITRE